MVLVESGLNSEQVSLMTHLHCKMHFGTETSGLKRESGHLLGVLIIYLVIVIGIFCV